MVLTSLINGSGFFLRRIGVIDRGAYHRDLSLFCSKPLQEWWLPASCHFRKVLSLQPLRVLTLDTRRLYASPGAEILLKLTKYGFLSGLVILSLLLAFRGRNRLPGFRSLLPVLPLLASLAIGWFHTLHQEGLALASLSLLSLLWVALMLTGGWLSRPQDLRSLALAVALLLVLQLPLGLIEAARGLPTSFGPLMTSLYPKDPALPSRLSQAFIMPNTLGVMVVCGLGFCWSYGDRRWIPWLSPVVLCSVALARSGAGLAIFLPLISWFCLNRLRPKMSFRERGLLAIVIGACVLAGMLVILPIILGRADLFQSLMGRVGNLIEQLDPHQPITLLFGKGLGAAGNRLSSFLHASHALQPQLKRWIVHSPSLQNTDSMVILLITQGGLVAVLSFYGLLLWSFCRDATARPFLATILLGSLTLNISEIFPLDLLLALSLNHSLFLPRCASA